VHLRAINRRRSAAMTSVDATNVTGPLSKRRSQLDVDGAFGSGLLCDRASLT
jgi:hypothetical protein